MGIMNSPWRRDSGQMTGRTSEKRTDESEVILDYYKLEMTGRERKDRGREEVRRWKREASLP